MSAASERVLDLALGRPAGLGRTRLLCVDGPAGSGKTTFAERLAQAALGRGLTVSLVHMDDVYAGWSGLGDAGGRVLEQIIAPLVSGRPAAYARYDWHLEDFGPVVAVPVTDLLVIEGVGSADPLYAMHICVLVWVWAPAELRLERGLYRDGDSLAPRWRQWMLDEDRLHARDRTVQRADVVVDGRSGELSPGSPGGA